MRKRHCVDVGVERCEKVIRLLLLISDKDGPLRSTAALFNPCQLNRQYNSTPVILSSHYTKDYNNFEKKFEKEDIRTIRIKLFRLKSE